MPRWTLFVSLLLALGGLSPAAFGSRIEVTEASRRLDAWVYGYDYDFDDGAGDTAANVETEGAFDTSLLVDLSDWYGHHVGTSTAAITSMLAPDRLHVAFVAEGNIDNAGIFTADAGGEGQADIAFDVDTLARVQFTSSASRLGEAYAVGSATLAPIGGPALASMSLHADATAASSAVLWLMPGAYDLHADLQAWAFGGSGRTEIARGELDLDVRIYGGGDLDLDGDADPADLGAFMEAYDEGDDGADVNGDAQVTAHDRELFWRAWRNDALVCPGDLDANGVVAFDDLLVMLTAWGSCAFCPADLDADGAVTFSDLVTLLAHWGGCSASP